MTQKLDLLAIGAHPDDVEAGCGGTIAKMSSEGKRCGILDLSDSKSSTKGDVETRNQEKMDARKVLGCKHRFLVDCGDTKINSKVNDLTYQHRIIEVIRETRPEVVLLPYYNDHHPDHEAVSRVVMPALYYSGVKKVGTTKYIGDKDPEEDTEPEHFIQQDPWRPRHVYFYPIWYTFEPSFILGLRDEDFENKLQSLYSYKSQFDPKEERHNMIDLIKARNLEWGYRINARYGEAFLSRNHIGINGLSDLRPNYYNPEN